MTPAPAQRGEDRVTVSRGFFLWPVRKHKVVVDTIGTVYEGHNAREARRTFKRWQKFSAAPVGRASGKRVIHTKDGKIETTNL